MEATGVVVVTREPPSLVKFESSWFLGCLLAWRVFVCNVLSPPTDVRILEGKMSKNKMIVVCSPKTERTT